LGEAGEASGRSCGFYLDLDLKYVFFFVETLSHFHFEAIIFLIAENDTSG
jgi:hypothetical protein